MTSNWSIHRNASDGPCQSILCIDSKPFLAKVKRDSLQSCLDKMLLLQSATFSSTRHDDRDKDVEELYDDIKSFIEGEKAVTEACLARLRTMSV